MNDWEKQTTIMVTNTRRALEQGKLHAPPGMRAGIDDILKAPLTPMGLVGITKLSKAGIRFGRLFGIAKKEFFPEPAPKVAPPLAPEDAQCELFRHFSHLFAALTGEGAEHIADFDEIRPRLIARMKDNFNSLASSFNSAADELTAFYNAQGHAMFSHAKSLGG